MSSFVAPHGILEYPEADFQKTVIEMAGWLGYVAYHETDSRKSQPGFPDLTLVGTRGVRQIVYVELKVEVTPKTKRRAWPTVDQVGWLEMLRGTGHHAYVIRPSQLDLLERVLLGEVPTPDPLSGSVAEVLEPLLEAERQPIARSRSRRRTARYS